MNAELYAPYSISKCIISCLWPFNLVTQKNCATDKSADGKSEAREVTCASTTFTLSENSSCTSPATLLHQRLLPTAGSVLSYILLFSRKTLSALRAAGCESHSVAELTLWGKIKKTVT